MEKIPHEIKAQLIQRKIQIWRNTYYDAELDAKVAEALGDEQGKMVASSQMKNALKAIDFLETTLSKLVEGVGNGE